MDTVFRTTGIRKKMFASLEYLIQKIKAVMAETRRMRAAIFGADAAVDTAFDR